MMRQMGGSFGIAFINTFLDHRTAAHRLDLVSRLAAGDPGDRRPAAASSPTRCSPRAPRPGRRPTGRSGSWSDRRSAQASLLSYLDAYRFVGILSIVCVPLILLAGRPSAASRGSGRRGRQVALISDPS